MERKKIARIVRSHFQELYKDPPSRDFEDIISLIDPVVTSDCNAQLVRNITREEVDLAIF